MPEDDDIAPAPRRSAFSPAEDDDLDPPRAARRSALSPLPSEEPPVSTPRRSAFTPAGPDDDDAVVPRRSEWYEDEPAEARRSPAPRRANEYPTAARAIQPALPELGPSADSPTSPGSPPEAPSPVAEAVSPDSPSVQPTLPDPVPTAPIEVAAAGTAPELTEALDTDEQELRAEEEAMVSEGGPSVGDDTATWLFGAALSDADHSLYRRPAPGDPETEVDLTPIVIDDPEYDVRKGTSPSARSSSRAQSRTHTARPARGRTARRMHVAWRDHRRLLTIASIVLALLLVVGGGGYLLSRVNPALAAITQGALTLPATAGDYRRDPSQGSTPSADPNSTIQTVSATYTLKGEQEFVAIAYRPQVDPKAALQEIQARSITQVNGGACGRTSDQSRLACAVVSGATAVLLMTLVDQQPDELIAAAQSVASGIGRG